MGQNKVFTTNKYGEKLVGLIDFSNIKQEKQGTIILVHGFGVDKTDCGMFDEIAPALTKEGFTVYRFDFSGRGESEGNYSKTSLSKLVEDLRSIIDFVKIQPNVDANRIGLVGMSLGTSVAIGLNASEIATYVLLGTVAKPYESLRKLFEKHTFNPNGISIRITSRGKRIEMGPQFWTDFDKYDLVKTIVNVEKPICFIHGELDSKTSITETEELFYKANEPKKLVVVKNSDHDFEQPVERQEMIKETLEWFNKYL